MSHLRRIQVRQFHATFVPMLGLLLLLLAACNVVSPGEVPADTTLTTTAQRADGLVLISAASFTTNIPRFGHTWTTQKDPTSANGVGMLALPDAMTTRDTKLETLSPRLDYRVAFKTAGTYYIWVYGRASDKTPLNGDSLHVGLGGKPVASSSRITNLPATYGWASKTMAGKRATLSIATPGTFTLNVWMREDGARFGALALSSNARFTPSTDILMAPSPTSPVPGTEPAPTPLPTNIDPVPARAADAFIDSVGVNTHFHYDDTVWGSKYELIKAKLIASGIRHARDGLYTYAAASRDSFYYSRLRELGTAGIRFNLTTGMKTSFGEMSNFDLLDDVYEWTNGAVVAYEGVNEPDIQGVQDWTTQATTVQRELYENVNNNPLLSNVTVIGPSPVWEPEQLGNLSQLMDYGNSHAYNGGAMPMISGYGSLEYNLDKAAKVSGSDPVMVTEVGYHNALKTSDGHPPTSEAVSATYLPRLLLSFFNEGIKRSYLYEFIDTNPDPSLTQPGYHFGLLRNDGSEKPAYTAIKTLLNLLKDPGTSFTPGSLRIKLTGNMQNVQQTLLQKRDGSFYLALWVEASSWDRDARRNLIVGEQQVHLQLGDPVGATTIYRFGDDGQASASGTTLQAGELEVSVNDKLTLIAFSPVRN